MTFLEQLKKDATQVFSNKSEFAEEVVYTPFGVSDGKIITATPEYQETSARGNTFVTTEGRASRMVLQVSAADVVTPIAGDKYMFANGKTWEMTHMIESDGIMHLLQLITDESPGW